MAKILRSRTFVRYLVIGASFLLICCVVMTGGVVHSLRQEYRQIQKEIAVSRMSAALDDLKTQVDLLSDIGGSILTNYRFRKSYWQQGEYYHMQLLSELKSYQNRSPLAEELVLIYNESDYVFMSSGYKTYLDIYARQYWNLEPEWFQTRLEYAFEQMLIERVDDGHLMFFIPVRTSGYSRSSGYASLVVVCDAAALAERIRAISGVDGSYSLSCNGILMLGEKLDEESALLSRRDSFVMRMDGAEVYSWDLIPHMNPIVAALLVLFTVAMILLLGYVNYRPIHGLASKYVQNASDELAAIDDMLTNLIQSEDESHRRLREIYSRTRRTLVRSVLYGTAGNELTGIIHMLEMSSSSQSYAVFAIAATHPENDYDNLVGMIEDLSDSFIAFHAVSASEDRCIAVIASMADRASALDAQMLLCSLLTEYSEQLEVLQGACCECAEEIPMAFSAVRETMNARQVSTAVRSLLDPFFDGVLAGDATQAQDAMERWVASLVREERHGEKSAVHEVIVSFLEEAERRGIPLPEPALNALVRSRSLDEFIKRMNVLTDRWCAGRAAPAKESQPDRGENICEYIRAHFSDPDLSLDMIAAEFDVSVNTVCRTVKQRLGKTFREYLIALRLEEARRLLGVPENTASAVCAAVGYTNLSYFIRSFKDYFGVTPSEYRQSAAH